LMPTTLFRRQAWVASGGFVGTMRPQGYEDWDFWLTLAECGWEGYHLAIPLVRYRRTNGSMLAAARQHDLELRAQIILNHAALYPAPFCRWARHLCASSLTQGGIFHSRWHWWYGFAGYLVVSARFAPRTIPKAMLRPLFCRLSARQQGYARRVARLLALSQGG